MNRFRWASFVPLRLLLLVLGTVLAGCRTSPETTSLNRYEFKSAHMGTLFSLVLYASNAPEAELAAEAAFRRIADLENILSDYQADSELNLLRTQPVGVPIPVSIDLFDVLSRARAFSQASDGAFDVTIGPLVRHWRFSRKRTQLPPATDFTEAKASVGWQHLRLDAQSRTVTMLRPGMQLDVGGIAKGYAADEALELLRHRGFRRALLAASGDIACGDPPPGQAAWKVGVPALGGTNVTHTILMKNSAVSTSGDAEQFVEIEGIRYSHIVSPWTGLGLTNRIQATVVAPNATTSDALATSVCILGPAGASRVLKKFPATSAIVVTSDGKTRRHEFGTFPRLEGRE